MRRDTAQSIDDEYTKKIAEYHHGKVFQFAADDYPAGLAPTSRRPKAVLGDVARGAGEIAVR
jgi:hypothetical protein